MRLFLETLSDLFLGSLPILLPMLIGGGAIVGSLFLLARSLGVC